MSSLSTSTAQRIRVLVVGLGTMGTSHARAYRAIEGFELIGLCTSRAANRDDLEAEFPGLPCFERFADTLEAARRVVSAASTAGKALLVGYILRVHPACSRFVEIGRTLGKPLLMR